jgi:single-stranded-DNA-specific exonuclease
MPNTALGFTESVITNRGIQSLKELDLKLSDLEPPQFMKDAEKGAKVAAEAIENNEKVVVYGDYDADGNGCIVIATLLFRLLGFTNFDTFHNNRWDGFGMNKAGIDAIVAKNPDVKLIITADNGIVAFDAVEYANSLGIKVIITDHHMPDASGKLPNAVAVIDPHRADETCKYRELCGTGVLFKFMALVFYYLGADVSLVYSVLDFVALATVADVVPITGENRILVKHGLELMNGGQIRPEIWLSFLKQASSFKPKASLTSVDLGFTIGPCVNACSRMSGNLKEALNAFLETPIEEVPEAISNLMKINEIRKTVMNTRCSEGKALIPNDEDLFIVIAMEHCEEGIVGLVAGNICNALYKPVIVLTKEEKGDNWKGSGRSIEGIDVKGLLDIINEADPSIFVGYGGHSQACGLTVRDGKVDDLRRALNEYCRANFSENTFVEKVVVDYIMKDPTELPQLYADKCSLEPFGCEFPEPLILVKFKPDETALLKGGLHLKFRYKNINLFSWRSGYHLNGRKPEDIEEIIAVCKIEDGETLNCSPELLQIRFKN